MFNFNKIINGVCMFCLLNSILFTGCSDLKNSKQPKAEKIKTELTIHGHTRIDNYYWLKNRDDKKVIDYLVAENNYTNVVMAHTVELQKNLYNEIIGRIKQSDESVPYKLNRYYYYKRYEPGKEYPIYCRKKDNLNNEEEILLDVNEMGKGQSFVSVLGLETSPNNKILAYGVDFMSRRKYTVRFKDLKSGKLLEDKLINTNGKVAWANDNKTVFYTIKDETLRPYKIFKHVLGTDPAMDVEVHHETDSTFTTYVKKSKSQKYIMVHSESILSTESRFLDADNPNGKFKIIQKRERNLEYFPQHFQDKFYIRTNYQAKNFKIISTPVNKTDKKYWKDVIAHRNDVLVEALEIFKDFFVVDELHNGLTKLRIKEWNNSEYYINFDEPAYRVYLSKNLEFNTQIVRFVYSSLTTPESTFDYNMKSKKKKMLKMNEVAGEYNPDEYATERIFADTQDGIKVPISLVYKKELKKQKGNPLLLYGYGSYGYSTRASFKSYRISLLDRGFIFAIAHVRGGQEMGRWWYEDGKLFKKKNTFTDFIASAEHLINEKYTNKEMLFALGGSAGGLLMGAIVNIRPDLFKGVIANVPWVDVITTMLDPSIPLTSSEYDEWGDPIQKSIIIICYPILLMIRLKRRTFRQCW